MPKVSVNWEKLRKQLSMYRSSKHFKPFLCQILNAPSAIEGANKWLAAIGLLSEKSCSPKLFLNWPQISKECLTTGLLLGISEVSGSAAPKRVGKETGLLAQTSIVTQAGEEGSRWKCFQYNKFLIFAAQKCYWKLGRAIPPVCLGLWRNAFRKQGCLPFQI